MERRETHRTRRRVPCLFSYEGHVHNALVVDLSVGGMFLQTDTAVSPGTELTLRLRSDAFEDIELRGRVVRRRFTPTVIATLIRRGVGIQILSAPTAYYDALGASQESEEPSWSALQDQMPPFEPSPREHSVTIDAQRTPPPVGLSPAWDEKTDERIAAAEDVWESASPEEATAGPAAPEPVWAPKASWRADALLIHDGELADVVSLLEGMGADTLSQRDGNGCGLEGWERPPRMIVANGASALRLALGADVDAQGIVAIAVVDSGSQTLCGMLRRQGFRYVVRRPVHPEALRLLLGRALFRGRERRDAARVSLGCEVAFRVGLRRRSATLLELCRTGCRLWAPDWVEPGDHLSLRVPSEVTGNRPLGLPGRVLRSQRQRRGAADAAVAVALRFDRLADSTRARLEALITAHTLGPTPLGRITFPGGSRPHALAPTSGAAAAPARVAHDGERRQTRRRLHRHEVVALDAALERVRFALLGIDLSAGGIRVEPHPEIALGDRLRIAIYEAVVGAPILVDAVAVRDDGARGVVLRFRDVSAGVAHEIARVLEGAPQLEAVGGAAGAGVVVAELIDCQPA
jgi:hypothetical protein